MALFKKNYKKASDEELMTYLAQGEQRAFDEIYSRYAQPLMHYFMRMLWKDREKAEDFVHDLFTKFINKPELFDVSRSFKTWLYSSANNMCKNEYKKQQVRSNVSGGLDSSYQVSDNSQSVVSQVQDKQFDAALATAIDNLDDKHREVFTLRHFQDLSMKEISEAIGKSEGTVKSRLFYATKKIAESVKEFDPVLNR